MKLDFEENIKAGVEQAMKECELTIGMTLKECVEKQIAKKPDIPWDTQREQCPVCQGSFIGKQNYCSECGQKIDWRAHQTEKGGGE